MAQIQTKTWKDIATDIEQTLMNVELIEFTIGKTEHPDDREFFYCQKHSYTHFCIIGTGVAENVNYGEIYLTKYFLSHSILNEKIGNERKGGAGNLKANVLYVAIRNKEHDINHLDGNILPNDYPFDLNMIKEDE